MPSGYRKAALYLSSLAPADRRVLVAALPESAARSLQPLIDTVIANGWNTPELVGRALAGEIRGLTAESSLSVDALLALAKALPEDWTARIFAANAAVDAKFLITLLDKPTARRVEDSIARCSRLPDGLKNALLAEAADSVRTSA